MNKRIINLIIFTLILIVCIPSFAEGNDVLFVYQNDIEKQTYSEVLSSIDITADFVFIENYDKSMLGNYEYVILTVKEPLIDVLESNKRAFLIGDDFIKVPGLVIEENTVYNGEIELDGFSQSLGDKSYMNIIAKIHNKKYKSYGWVLVGKQRYPFGIFTDNYVFVPYVSEQDISILAVGDMLKQYFLDSNSYPTYIQFSDIYGFSDLESLKNVTDSFFDKGTPLIFSIMPQMDNTDYPSYDRFVEILSYSQSKNVSVVVNPPLSGNKEAKKYAENLQLLSNHSIIFAELYTNIYQLKFDFLNDVKFDGTSNCLPIRTVIDYSILDDVKRCDEILSTAKGSGIVFGDYRRSFSNDIVNPENIEINNEFNFKQEQEIETEFVAFFEKGRLFLTIGISVGLMIAILFIGVGNRYYRKKYMKRK